MRANAIHDAELGVLGQRVRQYRKALGLTQLELAYRADIDPATISLIENAKREPGVLVAKRIADALLADNIDELLS